MIFEYLKTERFEDSVDIESIGNCLLQTINDEADSWVLKTTTELGMTTVVQAGPYNLDFDEASPNVYISKTSFEYNEKKLYKIIYDFLNTAKRNVTSVEIIEENAYENILDKVLQSMK